MRSRGAGHEQRCVLGKAKKATQVMEQLEEMKDTLVMAERNARKRCEKMHAPQPFLNPAA